MLAVYRGKAGNFNPTVVDTARSAHYIGTSEMNG